MKSSAYTTPLTPLKGGVVTTSKNDELSPLEGGLRGVILTLFLFLSHLHFLFAQDAVLTLNQFTPLQYQPSASVLDYQAEVSFLREEFQLGPGNYLLTTILNAELPLVEKTRGGRPLGIGLGFAQRDYGQADLLKTLNLNLSLASSVRLTSNQLLAFGLSGAYINKRTSIEQLSTGSQWIQDEFRYDPNAGLGETFDQNQINYFSAGSGIYWSLSHQGNTRFFTSLSAFHINRPAESFFQENVRIPINYFFNAGAVVVRTNRLEITPQLYYSRSGRSDIYQLMTSAKLQFENSNPYDLINTGALELLLNLSSGKELGVGIVIHQPNYKIGGGYQVPMGGSSIYQSKFQIAFSVGFLTWEKEPQVITIEQPETRRFVFTDDKIPVVKRDDEITLIENRLEELDEVKSLQFELEKDFQFLYGKAELIGRNDPFLKDLTRLLTENPDYQLKVIGHTDDMGSHQVNLELSRARAQSIADHLINNGVSASQITTIGMGDTQPAETGNTEAAKAKNRRVEFMISIGK